MHARMAAHSLWIVGKDLADAGREVHALAKVLHDDQRAGTTSRRLQRRSPGGRGGAQPCGGARAAREHTPAPGTTDTERSHCSRALC